MEQERYRTIVNIYDLYVIQAVFLMFIQNVLCNLYPPVPSSFTHIFIL